MLTVIFRAIIDVIGVNAEECTCTLWYKCHLDVQLLQVWKALHYVNNHIRTEFHIR
jgi:hypothetical protein